MNSHRTRFVVLFLAGLSLPAGLAGCNLQQLQEAQRTIDDAANATPTPTPSCADFNEYDTYSDCQTATSANCSSEWQTFTGGGVALCYYPVAGWEVCSTTTTDWVYTPYTETICRVGATAAHWKARSVIGCGSAVCACLQNQSLVTTCTMGTDCPTPSPYPNPTPYYPACP